MEVLAEEIMEKSNPVTNVNGTPVISFEEQRDLSVEVLREHAKFKPRAYNPDGTVKRSKVTNAAINMGAFFDNRYKKGKDKIFVVTAQTTDGYRAIQEQASGRMSDKHVPALVFGRDKEGNLEYKDTVLVKDEEFISEYTHKLSEEAMRQILPLMPVDVSVADDALPI